MFTDDLIRTRQERAKQLFKQGFNCSQAVFASCADLFGFHDEQLALRISASFGGGIGRMRLTCGAACGMFMLESLRSGSCIPGDMEGKGHNYERVQTLANAFQHELGALACKELTGLDANGPHPEQRTDAYYHRRPCVDIVSTAVRIFLLSCNE